MIHKYITCITSSHIFIRADEDDISDFLFTFKVWCCHNNLTTLCWVNSAPGNEGGAWRLPRDALSSVNDYLLTNVAANDVGVQTTFPCPPSWTHMPCGMCGAPTELQCSRGCDFCWQFENSVNDDRHHRTYECGNKAIVLPRGRTKRKLQTTNWSSQ